VAVPKTVEIELIWARI